jgi:hypothetical protein
MDDEIVVLSIEVIWILCAISLTNWWDIAVRRLWADACSCIMFSASCSDAVILGIVSSRLVCFISHHLIVMDIIILLLRNLEVLRCICPKLFGA